MWFAISSRVAGWWFARRLRKRNPELWQRLNSTDKSDFVEVCPPGHGRRGLRMHKDALASLADMAGVTPEEMVRQLQEHGD